MSRTFVVFAAVSGLIFAAVSGLIMPTALAQAPSGPATAPAVSGSPQVVATQSSDELLASKLKGTAVMGSDDQKIGDISDILFDKMGHVKAYIVSVGGILGIGAKEIALEQGAFREMPVIEGRSEEKQFLVPQLQISMTKDQLKQMAAFKALSTQPSTTGVAPAAPPADK
jgi:sporulation protein YlmC with PRC-barrel domain